VATITNTPLYQTEQGVFQTELKVLLFTLVDMHELTLKIKEDMKFQRGLSVKQFLKIFQESDID
jgi:hypothetical protein